MIIELTTKKQIDELYGDHYNPGPCLAEHLRHWFYISDWNVIVCIQNSLVFENEFVVYFIDRSPPNHCPYSKKFKSLEEAEQEYGKIQEKNCSKCGKSGSSKDILFKYRV